ncbi:peptidoglycan recognition protein family protein [Streptomyces sp. SLBN-115]|uniref:peptidoglycan recognition protein family protein n=1 Tax=Streptomyces sp. SLBN-115 TaxID=2768453 RepID=UPI00116FD3B5|nr:peptidoglycan recognition protein [Streptomyces sp. SLBN-115]TQJ53522.1 N-acetylmuramoyl-L-alanine amidase [Streptomyces sp. SLBN-115]
MRGLLATSIGVTCAAALALPLTPPASAATARPASAAEAAPSGTARATSPDTPVTSSLSDPSLSDHPAHPALPDLPDLPDVPALPDLPGSTQSLPLTALARDRALGGAATDQGLPRRDVRHFSLLGVVWDDPAAELHGRVQVRTRTSDTGAWSGWQDVETHNADHGADPGTPESASGRVRGATAPLWVGDSDGVEIRVHPDTERRTEETVTAALLPSGLRLELVDPGSAPPEHVPAGPPRSRTLTTGSGPAGTRDALDPPGAATEKTAETAETATAAEAGEGAEGVEPGEGVEAGEGAEEAEEVEGAEGAEPAAMTAMTAEATAASAANAALAPLGATQIPALDRLGTERELLALRGAELTPAQRAKPYIGPRPSIVTRRGWGADEKLREKKFVYTTKVKAAFVHHTASGNSYKCSQAPSVIRGIYRYHVRSMGWRDIGYNFLVDKCGKIYEGRAGGVAKPVLGAHTLGFNTNSMGIAVLGTFTSAKPTTATVNAVARLTAWKLGLFGANPKGKTYLKSGGGNLYGKGKNVRLNVISGHRDGFATECPGRQLYGKLGSARSTAARFQGR